MKSFHVPLLFFLLAVFTVCGCSGGVASLDRKDRDNLLVRDAASRRSSGNIDGALQLYSEALDRDPKQAVAHLDLAIIFHDYKKDYLRAIYHYERYLELRPKAEKRVIIEDRIRLAGLAFAAKAAGDNKILGEMGKLSSALTELKKENDALKSTILELNLKIEQSKRKPVAVAAGNAGNKVRMSVPIVDDVPVTLPGSSSRSNGARVHQVKRGERLTGIAFEYYKDARKSDDIFKANRDKLASPNDLREGQVLVIP